MVVYLVTFEDFLLTFSSPSRKQFWFHLKFCIAKLYEDRFKLNLTNEKGFRRSELADNNKQLWQMGSLQELNIKL